MGGGGSASGLGPSNWAAESSIRWTPLPQHAGKTYYVCLRLFLSGGRASPPDLCVTIMVEKCSYCARSGDTFEAVAVTYGTTWGQIYAANTSPLAPPPGSGAVMFGGDSDGLLPRTYLRLGPVYSALKRMTLDEVATTFATSVEALRAANPDLEGVVGAGTMVCVLPGVCDTDEVLSAVDTRM